MSREPLSAALHSENYFVQTFVDWESERIQKKFKKLHGRPIGGHFTLLLAPIWSPPADFIRPSSFVQHFWSRYDEKTYIYIHIYIYIYINNI